MVFFNNLKLFTKNKIKLNLNKVVRGNYSHNYYQKDLF